MEHSHIYLGAPPPVICVYLHGWAATPLSLQDPPIHFLIIRNVVCYTIEFY